MTLDKLVTKNKRVGENRWAIHPGFVISRSDGQRHYVGARQLADLYGVPFAECVVVDIERPEGYLGKDLSGLVHLHVKYDGNYPKNNLITLSRGGE
jgi:hypothetical protein